METHIYSFCTAPRGHSAAGAEQDTLWPSSRKRVGKLLVLLHKLAEGGRHQRGKQQSLLWNKRAKFKAFQTVLLRTAHHFVCLSVTLHFFWCIRLLKDEGKAWVPNIGNQERSRAFLQVSWTVLCLETSSASRSQWVNPPHTAKHPLLHHVESCRHVPHILVWLRIRILAKSSTSWLRDGLVRRTGPQTQNINLHLLPTTGNRDYPAAHTQPSPHTPPRAVLLS